MNYGLAMIALAVLIIICVALIVRDAIDCKRRGVRWPFPDTED